MMLPVKIHIDMDDIDLCPNFGTIQNFSVIDI
ncbi:hypothetical protein XaFJ1_GM003209 [Xanthomonas albilineans]|nr:hypothetical protein XaFJ1_GM003209 [Xanthomonas albilineans]